MTGRLVLLSLERWDEVWRRNQHLSAALVRLGVTDELLFVEPPSAEPLAAHSPTAGITVVRPPLPWAPKYGSVPLAAAWLRAKHLRAGDRVWINNAPLGRWLLGRAKVYDVTDDWRETSQGVATRRRLVRAEDRLAARVPTIVCSEVLRERWQSRYGVTATVVHNGIDANAFHSAVARPLEGDGPHAMYVGTLHSERLDLELCLAVAEGVGTLHLIGPDHLSQPERARLRAHPRVRFDGRVPAAVVPSLLVSADVLVVPHVVTPFTLSLDAIKAYEYLATDRPVVATPSSGFQSISAPGLVIAGADDFADRVVEAASLPSVSRSPVPSWDDRAKEFASVLDRA